jgi:GH24 family phage-related lysozyme (muramidase)
MRIVKTYNSFNEEKIVNDIINYIDYSINEGVDIESIWNKAVNKIKNLSEEAKRKVIKYVLVSLLAFNTVVNVSNLVKGSNADPVTKEIAASILSQKDLEKTDSIKVEESKWKKGYEFTFSQKGWNHIKMEEGNPRHPGEPVLKAYKIGDGKITVGWGHAEPVRKSKFKVGQKITTSDADELLKMDLTNASDGVRRIFKDWEEKGLDVKINQDMFDALVSIAFNTGINGLRKSMMIQDIKKGNFEEAGEKIKTLNVSKKFPGLHDRREKESEMFLASL